MSVSLRKTALVTGACSGIGRSLAQGLAARGYDLVLVSNRDVPLSEAAKELSLQYGITALSIPMDLSSVDAAESLFQQVSQRGIEIEVLVNNAGIFFFGEVADADPVIASRLVRLCVLTPSLLCTYFAKGMRARRSGRILMVSSISAFRDFPGIAYYGSSKKYLRGFSQALRSELSVYGVSVTCLLPGATATSLYDPNVVPVELAKKLGIMADADSVSEQGLAALFSGQAECIPGALNRVLSQLAESTPQPLIDLLRRHAPWLPPK